MDNLQVEYVLAASLSADPRNARTHSEKQIGQVARSIGRFGFNNPILIGDDMRVIAGHARLAAAMSLGLERVPIVRLSHLTAPQRRAYIIADNRLAELSGWDPNALALEFKDLAGMELDFELTDMGFEIGEVDLIIQDSSGSLAQDEDPIPEVGTVPRVAQAGDLWQLDEHLLLCGDALSAASYMELLGDDRAAMVFADPPYNVKVQGHVSGLGKAQHREFVQASGDMSDEEFVAFLQTACQRMAEASKDGALSFVCMDWRHIADLIPAALTQFTELKNLCVWVKSNGGMGSLYRSRHELVAVFKSGKAAHRNNVQLGKMGRYRTNVWEYDGMNSFQSGRTEKLAMHPTVKPIALIADAILDCTARGDLILDPFCGSGSSILAAELTGRRCRAIELDPAYVDVSIARFAALKGPEPVNLRTGLTFAEHSDGFESEWAPACRSEGNSDHA